MTRSTLDLGLAVLRVGVGATMAAHGVQKLFGALGGHGIEGTAQGMEAMGFTPAKPSAMAAGLGETAGLMLALGAGTPLAGAAVAGTTIAAGSVHAPNGFWATNGGFEYNLVLGVSSAALALTGPGKYSVDALLGHRLNTNKAATLGLLAAVGAGAAIVARRRQALAARAAQASSEDPADPAGS